MNLMKINIILSEHLNLRAMEERMHRVPKAGLLLPTQQTWLSPCDRRPSFAYYLPAILFCPFSLCLTTIDISHVHRLAIKTAHRQTAK